LDILKDFVKKTLDGGVKITFLKIRFGGAGMGFFESLLVKFIGKYLDADLQKWHVSKAKVIAIIAAILPAVPSIAASIGYPVTIPPVVYEILTALGLWAAGHDTSATPQA